MSFFLEKKFPVYIFFLHLGRLFPSPKAIFPPFSILPPLAIPQKVQYNSARANGKGASPNERRFPDNGLVILKVIHENGEDLLSTLDSDEELDAVYDLFVESLFDEDESEQ